MKYALLLIGIFAASLMAALKKDKWTSLFNGKDLQGWDSYLRPEPGHPGGLNNDQQKVFTVVRVDGENVIRVSGEAYGGISTREEFENYHFQLRFKWGVLTWGQKKGKKKDSGLLYHSVGANGADGGAWMRSQEFQIEEGNCGDYWGCAGGIADIPATMRSDSGYVYDPSGSVYTFRADNSTGRHCIKQGDAEKPTGEWNTLDLYCHGDTSVHVVNGKVMMILYHNRQQDNGQVIPLTRGKIQLQSEGAELFYKDIKIQSIERLPAVYLH